MNQTFLSRFTLTLTPPRVRRLRRIACHAKVNSLLTLCLLAFISFFLDSFVPFLPPPSLSDGGNVRNCHMHLIFCRSCVWRYTKGSFPFGDNQRTIQDDRLVPTAFREREECSHLTTSRRQAIATALRKSRNTTRHDTTRSGLSSTKTRIVVIGRSHYRTNIQDVRLTVHKK